MIDPMADDGAPSPNDLGKVIIDPRVRAGIYTAFVVLLTLAYGTNAAYGALHISFPDWLVAGNAVLNALGLPIGGLAIANIPKKGSDS